VTFGYAVVADATRLWGEHRRKMALAMARFDTVVDEVTRRRDGTLVVSAGESVGVAFHRAEDAAMWATQLQVAVEQEPWPGGVEVRVQLAPHTGETEELDGGYFGPAVHTTARPAAAAHGGQTLVSGVTAALLEREDLRDLGTHSFDGVGGEQDIRQLDAGDRPPIRSALRRGNLPRRLGRLVGRDAELDVVALAMEASPVVTLVGPGGVGKTTLALAAARRSETDDPRRVVGGARGDRRLRSRANVVAETLGITGGAGRTLTDSIMAALRSRPTLLVLDNCEHVIDGAAALARALADDAAQSRVLATSREGLGIPGEQLIVVAPLDFIGAAVELFDDRARAAVRSVRSGTCPCRRRRDLSPARRAAARDRTGSRAHHTLTPGQLLSRLDDRIRLPGGRQRTTAERHRTLRATVQWSFDLLSPQQEVLFERLAVFTGPFDLAGAEAVAGDTDQDPGDTDQDPVETDQLLGDLVERSIVAIESGALGRRFRLLDTLRRFAFERLAVRGELEAVARRHAYWCPGRDRTHRRSAGGPRRDRGRRPSGAAVAEPAGSGRLGLHEPRCGAG
jgi:predicted ATPase/class 3 adenylate cyclase